MAGKKKILIVEDNYDIRQLMVFYLEQMGYDVLEAATGLAALERASATLPDLITMDLGLPDITGDKATARLKADPSTKHIPVIAITAYYKESPLAESAVAAGACEVLCKPIALQSLDDALRRLLTLKPNERALQQHEIKQSLPTTAPAKGGLILHSMFYANEIRDFNEIPKGEASPLTPAEFDLANGLVEKLSSENFEPEAYEDEYQNRVRAMLDSKVKGQEITVPPKAPARGHIIDLMEALKESMKTVERGKKRADQRKRRKA